MRTNFPEHEIIATALYQSLESSGKVPISSGTDQDLRDRSEKLLSKFLHADQNTLIGLDLNDIEAIISCLSVTKYSLIESTPADVFKQIDNAIDQCIDLASLLTGKSNDELKKFYREAMNNLF